jgi:hypothetical protein
MKRLENSAIRHLLLRILPSLFILIGRSDLQAESRALAADGDPRAERPNILLLLTDDQRADTIHALGNSVIQTPNLDRLATSGLVFNNAYCMGSTIPAVCFTSRTSLVSGQSP